MTVINVTRGVILAKKINMAETFKSRLKGLIGTSSLPKGHALLIKPCASVHTFFMQYPIDVVFLNEDNRIIRVIHSLPPYRLGPIVRGAKKVLELPADICRHTGTRTGDLLRFKSS
ncbi:MAG: DUF192 domain-containing protein [Desulfotomaculum sp.]|nr:DUF192 domain-containing protein [Desulfotomaculum sp.]